MKNDFGQPVPPGGQPEDYAVHSEEVKGTLVPHPPRMFHLDDEDDPGAPEG